MRQRRFYAAAFLLVLLAAFAGAYAAAKSVGRVDVTLPRLDFLATVQKIVGDINLNALLPRSTPSRGSAPSSTAPTTAAPSASPQAIVEQNTAPPTLPAPPSATITATMAAAPAVPAESPGAGATAPAERPTATPAPPTPTPTAAPQPPPSAAFPFMPAGAVRHSAGDCPGPSIRGAVRDAAGNPLPNVQLWRYDQWGNQQTVTSKAGAADLGQYDFPLGDIANVHYVQVVDAGGAPISPTVEIQHRQGNAADATCHWLDWVRR